LYQIVIAILKIYENKLQDFAFEECVSFLRRLPEDMPAKRLFNVIEGFVIAPYLQKFVDTLEKAEDKVKPPELTKKSSNQINNN